MYLFEYELSTSNPRTTIAVNEILFRRGVKAEISRHSGGSINSMMILSFENLFVCLNEFPGNCSALILNRVQDYLVEGGGSYVDNLIEAAVEISQSLRYALLFVSGTSQIMRDYFITKYEFKVLMSDIKNPHSNNLNYFLVKEF